MKPLRANWVPVAMFAVIAALLAKGHLTAEQAVALWAAAALPGIKLRGEK